MDNNKRTLLDIDFNELQSILVNNKLPKFSNKQIYNWIYKKFNFNIDSWSNVSLKTKNFINEKFPLVIPKIITHQTSVDGTQKFLLELEDKNTIETVLIPAKGRRSLCLSTQIGCPIGCKFCLTGTQGITRNLKTSEIIGQYIAVTQHCINEEKNNFTKIGNLVYMGQGEPLLNLKNVIKSILIFMEDFGLGLSQRKITLSTSGLVSNLEDLNLLPPINIAISLHATTNEIRDKIMPLNKKFPLEYLFLNLKKVKLKAYRRITYEYILFEKINSTKEDAIRLSKLLDPNKSKINIIPFNHFPDAPSFMIPPSEDTILKFTSWLTDENFTCTVRSSKGPDILAACGQLKSKDGLK